MIDRRGHPGDGGARNPQRTSGTPPSKGQTVQPLAPEHGSPCCPQGSMWYPRAARVGRDLIGRYSIDLVLVPPQAPLAARLAEDRAWRLTFKDERAVMYVRQ